MPFPKNGLLPDQLSILDFGVAQGISLYAVDNLGTSAYAVKAPKASFAQGHPIEYLSDRQIRMRKNPSDLNQDGSPIHNMVYHYNSALRAIYEVRQSVQIMESGRIVDLRGTPISNVYPIDPHYLLEENQKLSLGDFWRVLRHRPVKNVMKSSNPDIEYIPNNTYPYYQVKKTLVQSARVQVKPCRYWNELPANIITDDIFYSLSDYWPSMPQNVDIINENTLLGLPLYRMNEQSKTAVVPARIGAKSHMANDHSYAIEFLLSTGAVSSDDKVSFEEYLTTICEAEMKYVNHIINWPFLVSQRLLRLQQQRLKTIKRALVERIDRFSLSDANSTGDGNLNPNVGNDPSDKVVEEGEDASSSTEDIDLMLFQRGETNRETSQNEIRPGQAGPGGWVF
jgi:hypothetical protein